MYTRELYHHGILGQRWGIRRYQRRDGTLTNAGKKHRTKIESEYAKLVDKDTVKTEYNTKKQAKLKAEYEELTGKKLTTQYAESQARSLSNMTDAQLKSLTERNNLEKSYVESKNNLITAKTRYADLTKPVPTETEKIVKEVKTELKNQTISTLKKSIADIGAAAVKKMTEDNNKSQLEKDTEKLLKELKYQQTYNQYNEAKDKASKREKNSLSIEQQAKDLENKNKIAIQSRLNKLAVKYQNGETLTADERQDLVDAGLFSNKKKN